MTSEAASLKETVEVCVGVCVILGSIMKVTVVCLLNIELLDVL